MRQQGAAEQAFQTALDNLRLNTVGPEDWSLVILCVQSEVPAKITQFQETLHIYPTRSAVADYNHETLRDSSMAVIQIKALFQTSVRRVNLRTGRPMNAKKFTKESEQKPY